MNRSRRVTEHVLRESRGDGSFVPSCKGRLRVVQRSVLHLVPRAFGRWRSLWFWKWRRDDRRGQRCWSTCVRDLHGSDLPVLSGRRKLTMADRGRPSDLRSFLRFLPNTPSAVGVPMDVAGEGAASVRMGAGVGLPPSFGFPREGGRPRAVGGVGASIGLGGTAYEAAVPMAAGEEAFAAAAITAGLGALAVGVGAPGVGACAGEDAETGAPAPAPFAIMGGGGGGRPAARAACVACWCCRCRAAA
jgi:hypothetical protein